MDDDIIFRLKMKQIEELISDLRNNKDIVMHSALLEARAIGYKLKFQQLIDWVNRELNGYADKDKVPPYRELRCVIFARVFDGKREFNHSYIPLKKMNKKQKKELQTFKMTYGIYTLDSFLHSNGLKMKERIEPEFYLLLTEELGAGWKVRYARHELSALTISQMIKQMKNKLIRFLTALNYEVGDKNKIEHAAIYELELLLDSILLEKNIEEK